MSIKGKFPWMDIPPIGAALRASYADVHDKAGAQYSVTELLVPPRIRQLRKRYEGVLAQGPDPNWLGQWRSLVGTGVHAQLEHLLKSDPDFLVEGQVWDRINGVKVAGRFDALYKPWQALYDFKLMKIYKFKMQDWEHFTQQQNIYRWMLREQWDIKSINIVGIWIDHFPNPFRRPDPAAPEAEITAFPLDLWSDEKTEEFVHHRLSLHENAGMLPTDELPLCTAAERWQTTKYKVMAKGLKRALRNCDTRAQAESFCFSYKGKYRPEDLRIDKVVGDPKRCMDWCEVAPYCNQFKEGR